MSDLYSRLILTKYATSKKDNDWESKLDPQAKLERDLIRKAQSGDIFAMKQLQSIYENEINSSISAEGLTGVMDFSTAKQEATTIFKNLVMNNFDLTQQVKPHTYIRGALRNSLKGVRYNTRDFSARKSETLTMYAEPVASANQFLQKMHGREPTDKETLDFIKNKMSTGASITLDNIKKINAYQRRELSGSQEIGSSDNAGEASFMTLSDAIDSQNSSPSDLYEQELANSHVDSIIENMDRNERRFVRNVYGLGEFKDKKAKNLYQATLNNNLTYHEGKKVLDKFKKLYEESRHGKKW